MPATDAGLDGARLKPVPSPRFSQPDPPAAPQSRRKSIPPGSQQPRSSRSNRPRTASQPHCRRQIPIDRTGRATETDPPAVSSPEACPTPANRVHRRHPATAGVRQPFTRTEVQRGPRNVRSWVQSRSRFRATEGLLLAISGLKPLRNFNRILTHRDAGGGSRPSRSGHVRSRWRMSPGLAAWFGISCGGSMNYN